MYTHFLTLDLQLSDAAKLQQSILAELHRYGEPLRWAITAVDHQQQTVQIEAVVTTASEMLLPDTAVTTA